MIQLKQKKFKKQKIFSLLGCGISNQRRLLELLKKSITNQDQQFSKKELKAKLN